MTIEHHPDESMLAAYAAGVIDLGQRIALATHLHVCARCRDFVRAMERAGGVFLEDAEPRPMSADALGRTLARLDEPPPPPSPAAAEAPDAPIELPAFVRRYAFGPWRFVAPRVRMRPIRLPEPGPTRVFLLKSAPNTALLEHAHTALEMTCVLSGAFRHDGGRYGPGDFDLGDDTVRHRPTVEDGEDCVSLVAMQGDLRWKGVWGRLAQPFIRL
ncbi:ChrR-like anti-ECFsigma factor [Roseiarcus fermentans]|uniref:ChrR-like anti-ECFsigma factor n=1 Tax=Roseiarcus fermentans TaxID=1473586 RepID=A0A366F5C6_9HYPH|nr:ChrR family anti-sigma-E factor [Roseiarcus fermentans]RBP09827.1 ChrR-like anti-ECFsigma factor [Roseiarcus fermentans]